MPSFPRDVINDDVAALIAYHIATLEHAATGAAVPSPPEVPASALRPAAALPPAPVVTPADPRTYEMKEYDAGSCGAGHDVAVAPDGRVWYAGIERNTIVMFDPRGERFRCWPVPTRNGQPQGIRVDHGLVWFTYRVCQTTRSRCSTRTELFSEFSLPHRRRSSIRTLVFNAERDPVFSLAYGDGAGRIDHKTGRSTTGPHLSGAPQHRSRAQWSHLDGDPSPTSWSRSSKDRQAPDFFIRARARPRYCAR
jgi:streptogramin lyase